MPSEARRAEKRCPVIPGVVLNERSPVLSGNWKDERMWRRVWREDAWRAQNGVCAYCMQPMKMIDATADHVDPQINGGRTSPKNIKACCHECNQAKSHWSEKRFKIALRDPQFVRTEHLTLAGMMRVWRAHMRYRIWNRVKQVEKTLRRAVK